MWLPSQFYEKAPHYWLVLGLLFILVGSYLGTQVERNYLFVGVAVGLSCCLWSIRVFTLRAKFRKKLQNDDLPPPPQQELDLTDSA